MEQEEIDDNEDLEEGYEEDDRQFVYQYTPPPKKTKEQMKEECKKKIQSYKDRILSTKNVIRKHKRLTNYHVANISVFENHIKLLEEELKDIDASYA